LNAARAIGATLSTPENLTIFLALSQVQPDEFISRLPIECLQRLLNRKYRLGIWVSFFAHPTANV